MMLPNWYCNCEMVVWKIRTNILICKNNVNPNNGILRVFGALH